MFSPPRFPRLLVRRAFRTDPARPAILGDLQEDFCRQARVRGMRSARRWYWREAALLALGRFVLNLLRTIKLGGGTMKQLIGQGGLVQDGVYALRTLRRAPGFALFTAAIIALGVGAATSVFSVLKPLLLAPLPFEDPHELVWIANREIVGDNSLSAVTSRSGNLRDFRAETNSFQGLTGYNAFFDQSAYTLSGAGEPERLVGVGVARDFLEVLGVPPLHGRNFTREEGLWDGPPAVILTHGLWRQRFDGDRSLVGGTLTLNQVPRTVVGVLPPSFDFSSIFSPGVEVDLLLPFPVSDETDRNGNTLVILGRLQPGVTPEQAQEELDAVLAALQEADPDRWGLHGIITPLQDKIAGPFRGGLLLLAGAAATVLLIVCVNLSNLLLARSPGRAREMAVRKAMGASRTRFMRQLVVESMAIAVLGGTLGAVMAWGVTELVAGSAAVRIPLLEEVRLDGMALFFAFGVALLTGLVVSLAPALQVSEGAEATVLRASSRGSSPGRGSRKLSEALVVAEVALACGLLVIGGLLLRSFSAVLHLDLGFEAENTVAWQLNPSMEFESAQALGDFIQTQTRRLAQVPGVEGVGLIDALPLGRNRSWGFDIPGRPETENDGLTLHPHLVGPGYLSAMRIEFEAGRNITWDDGPESEPVILLNESGAQRLFPGEEAIGKQIELWDNRLWRIVGVVEDVRHLSPEMGPGIQAYFPIPQMPNFETLDLVVRSERPVPEIARAVSSALAEVDPAMPTREFWTMTATVDRAVSARRFTLMILSSFGVGALLLAGLGIYGVLSQTVAEQTPEIGIRMALGASEGQVLRGVLVRTLVLAGIGVGLGVLLAFWGGQVVASLLFGVGRADPASFLGTGAILFAVAALAGAVPAIRAARVRGLRALRAE